MDDQSPGETYVKRREIAETAPAGEKTTGNFRKKKKIHRFELDVVVTGGQRWAGIAAGKPGASKRWAVHERRRI